VSGLKANIEEANQIVLQRIINSKPVWVDIKRASDACPGLKKNMIMHAGRPISWDRMCTPQKNGVKGAIIYEGWAKTLEGADKLVASGEVELSPCHDHNAVGSMCGITSPSMPVLVVKNETFGNEGSVLLYETPERQRLSMGSSFEIYKDSILKNLKWIDEVGAPVLKAVVQKMGSVNLTPIIAKALTAGDELHTRSFASTAFFATEIAPCLIELDIDKKARIEVAEFIRGCEQFFLHFAMVAGKVTADAAHGVEYSTVVTGISRNGVEAAIRVSGLPGQWFTGPSGVIGGLFFSNYTIKDAQPDMGDSAIIETIGLGGTSHAAAPALAVATGNVDMALKYTKEMEEICIGNNPNFGIPLLGGKGTPIGIDIRKVLDTGITPVINTAIAHKEGGQIGIGTSRAPIEAFKKALVAYRKKYMK
jgi:hypothetical protein